jgi:hypothetical protein
MRYAAYATPRPGIGLLGVVYLVAGGNRRCDPLGPDRYRRAPRLRALGDDALASAAVEAAEFTRFRVDYLAENEWRSGHCRACSTRREA